jgi:hypothetical protein
MASYTIVQKNPLYSAKELPQSRTASEPSQEIFLDLIQEAGHKMAWGNFLHLRRVLAALGHGRITSGMKATTLGRNHFPDACQAKFIHLTSFVKKIYFVFFKGRAIFTSKGLSRRFPFFIDIEQIK